MDAIDRKILKVLQEDATVPMADIARQCGLSLSPCWRRIQRLEATGVIQRRVALLDPAKLNVGVAAARKSNAFWRRAAGYFASFRSFFRFMPTRTITTT